MSKYLEIYEGIVKNIREGKYKSGEILPSELKLSTIYNASRDTVRKALSLLYEEGYIYKVKGKGSFVKNQPGRYDFPLQGLISFTEMMKIMNLKASTEVISFKRILNNKGLFKELPKEEKLLRIKRVRTIEGERVILDTDTIVESIVEGVSEEIAKGSLFNYMEKNLNLKIDTATKEITVVPCTSEDRKYLDMKGFDFIVVVDTYLYLEDGRVFQHTSSKHRPDRFKFIEHSRRRNTL